MPTAASHRAFKAPARVAIVVEDTPHFTTRIAEAFAVLEESWHLDTHGTGKSALAAVLAAPREPDVVLVDLGLPDISGLEIIEAVRRRWPQVPVLVISVLTSADAVVQAVRLGARGYLYKGESVRALAEAIRGVLDGDYPISPSLARHLFRLASQETLPRPGDDSGLSAREIELLRLLGQGYTYDEAARRMTVSVNTVRTFSRRIYQKLEVHSKSQALDTARQRGLLA
jgi:two-component system nitrate/nitrite response regulator NarL